MQTLRRDQFTLGDDVRDVIETAIKIVAESQGAREIRYRTCPACGMLHVYVVEQATDKALLFIDVPADQWKREETRH